LLSIFEAFGGWLRAVPGPTEHWATILSAWAWPISLLLAIYHLRSPLRSAADRLADRFAKDDIEIGSWLKLTTHTSLATLDQNAVTEEPGTPEAKDVRIIEALLEFAGDSDAQANRLLAVISEHGGPELDVEEFLTEKRFADLRNKVYVQLIGASDG
jgi:hypothetical protein